MNLTEWSTGMKPEAFFWNIAEKGCTREELIKEGLDVYEVSRELITKDVDKFINILKSNDLFE